MNIQELEKQADKALNFLADTDLEHAQLKAKQNLLYDHKKAILSAAFFASPESSAASKQQDAHRSAEYLDHLKLIEANDVDFIHLNNKRTRAVATIDLYRTVSANQRRGN